MRPLIAGRRALVLSAVIIAGSPARILAKPDAGSAPGVHKEERPVEGVPDVVRLKDGAFFRGTILEQVPSARVVLLLPGGSTRAFQANEVAYAGPHSGPGGENPAPGPDAALAPAAPGGVLSNESKEARIRLESNGPLSLTLHRLTGSAEGIAFGPGGMARSTVHAFDRLCTAPCELTLPVGRQQLALSTPALEPVLVEGETDIQDGTTLEASFESHQTIRTTAFVIALSAILGGTGMALVGANPEEDSVKPGLLAAGVATFAVGTFVALPFVFFTDDASLRVR